MFITSSVPAIGFTNEKKIIIDVEINDLNLLNQGDWIENQRLLASDGSTNDLFGISVSIYEDYAIVGSRDDDNQKGSAYIFKRSDKIWYQEAKLTASDGVTGDWFGISVSIYEDFAFVGADADDNIYGLNAGAIYVFKRNGTSWIEQVKLTASDGASDSYFGRSVSIFGDYAIVGAYYVDNKTGSAYVFKFTGGNWVEEDKLIASDGEAGDYFGITISIEENYALVGAYREDNSNGVDAGSAYVFKQNGTNWTEEAKIIASDGSDEDRFGIEVSMSKGFAIIGAYYDDSYTGSAYIFKIIDDYWVEVDKLTASDGGINKFFGRSVSIYDDYAIIGAWGNNSQTGSAYIFKFTGTNWIEYQNLIASDGKNGDRFAYQVDINGDYTIIGSYMADNENGLDAGLAYIFKNTLPNLICDGSLSWVDVKPGKKVYGNFKIINDGVPGSLLDWEITEKPAWGIWTISPEMGKNLTPEASPFTIDLAVIAPDDPKTEFMGEIKVVNSNDPSDYCIVPIYLKTPVNRPLSKLLVLNVILRLRQRSLFFL